MARSAMGPAEPGMLKPIEAPKTAEAKLPDMKSADMKSAEMKPSDGKRAAGKIADPKAAESRGGDAKPVEPKLVEAKAEEPKTAETKMADAPPAPDPTSPAAEVVASTSSDEEADAEAPGVAVKRTDFAVDLGGANSLGGLRALWRGVRYVNAELGALSPIVVIREGATGLGMQLHLAAGPLRDAAAAAKICAVLAERKRPCETTVYDGQKLAMREGEPQPLVAIKPAAPSEPKPSASRRGSYRHAAKREEPAVAAAPPPPPPPPPAETPSTFSQLFGRKP